MRIYLDSGDIQDISEWSEHPWISGFTSNPSLMRAANPGCTDYAWDWARDAVAAAQGKPISIDGPPEVWDLGPNVWRKMAVWTEGLLRQVNYTAVCYPEQIPRGWHFSSRTTIISVFAGRIMDTGRDPISVIDAAKATGAQVLWASVREPYNIVMAEDAGCDIVTVPPAILRKYLEWMNLPLEVVAERTIAQFEKDSEGLWT